MFIAALMIIAALAAGTWWLTLSKAAVARRRAENQRALERPDHDFERAREGAELQSELSRLKGWTGTGA